MKQTQGFGLVPLLIILALVLAGGGAYMYTQNVGPFAPKTSTNITASSTPTVPTTQPMPTPQPTPASAKSSLSATPTSGVAPLTVSFTNTAPTSNDLRMVFGDGSTFCKYSGEDLYTRDCWADIGSSVPFTHTYTKPGTYTAKVMRIASDGDGTLKTIGTVTITVTDGSTSATPTATIDQKSLTSVMSSSGPTITGSASGSSQVNVYLLSNSYTGSKDYATVSTLPLGTVSTASSNVSSGHWSASVGDGVHSIGPGTFQVLVYDGSSHKLLTSGTLSL